MHGLPSFADYHDPARMSWGPIRVNGSKADPRDGIAIAGEETIVVEALKDCELVMVDAR